MQKKKGISLIVLVITIIIMLILAGAVILTLSESNIINFASDAKLANDIKAEKEMLNLAILDTYAEKNTTEANLKAKITSYANGREVDVAYTGESYEILFKDVNRFYEIDQKQNITGPKEVVKDNTPGDITKNKDGKELQGTADEPYEIWSIEDLVALSAAVNGGYTNGDLTIATNSYTDKTIKLMTDLNFKSKMSYNNAETNVYNTYLGIEDETVTLIQGLTDTKNYKGFIPIGYEIGYGYRSFMGTFDGNNKTIKNLCENLTIEAGLFGVVKNATIKNLTVTGKIETSAGNAGGIVALVPYVDRAVDYLTTIMNCKNYVDITSSTYTGGIVGYGNNDILIENCENYGKIYSSVNAGGIVGYIIVADGYGTTYINRCANNGKVIGGENAGGILGLGHHWLVSIINCYNGKEAEVISEPGNAGGIIGANMIRDTGKLTNCYNLGSVTGNCAGGIAGLYSWTVGCTIKNCFSNAKIQGTTYKGGIAGESGRSYDNLAGENNYYIKTEVVTTPGGTGNIQNTTGITSLDAITIDALNKYITDNETEEDEIKLLKWALDSEGNPMFVNE